MKPDFFFLAIIPLIIICSPVLSQTSELQLFSDSITIDGRTYKVSPEFTIPPGIDKDSPVSLVFTDDTHELLSIERLKDDDSDSDELEYHFGIVNAIEALFYPGTKMSKTFYTKGALISMDMTGSYVKSSTDYPLVQSGDTLSPINGIIDEIVYFSENEIYFVSSGLSYFVNGDVKFLPDRNSFEKGSPFVGLMRNGRVAALYFTDNNRVKTINGTAASVDRNPDRNSIDFIVGGIKYHM